MIPDRVRERQQRELDAIDSKSREARNKAASASKHKDKVMKQRKSDQLDMSKVKMMERHALETARIRRVTA